MRYFIMYYTQWTRSSTNNFWNRWHFYLMNKIESYFASVTWSKKCLNAQTIKWALTQRWWTSKKNSLHKLLNSKENQNQLWWRSLKRKKKNFWNVKLHWKIHERKKHKFLLYKAVFETWNFIESLTKITHKNIKQFLSNH